MTEERTEGTAVNPHAPTELFERELCRYTGAKYAVTTNSCTMALVLALAWHMPAYWRNPREPFVRQKISIPRPGYISVPQSIIHAGGWPEFRDEEWRGWYQLRPLPVWDSARRFTSGMYVAGQFICVSFHASKILALEQGGAILHDNKMADAWLRKMRFDGRTEGVDPHEDTFDVIGHHCIMLPSIAAQLLLKLSFLPKNNPDMPIHDYPDLSLHPAFK